MKIHAAAISPSEMVTPLQIVCFPDVSLNKNMAGGTEAIDHKFNGAIADLRTKDIFHGDLFETLLLATDGKIPAKLLLLLGLGDPERLNIRDFHKIGKLIVNEAIKLDVESFSFAPSIKDAGISKFKVTDIASALSSGMQEAFKNAETLEKNNLIPKIKLKEIVLLAGAQHLENSKAGLGKATS